MKTKPRVVFDTNIYISAFLFSGIPGQVLELARVREIKLYISREIVIEIATKLREKFFWEEYKINTALEGVLQFATIIKPSEKVSIIKNDPKDNIILECAKEAKADYIISGDKKHILSLGKFRGIEILSSQEFLNVYYKKN
jgi:putative PIN family toxin of toxin-antitoxin system